MPIYYNPVKELPWGVRVRISIMILITQIGLWFAHVVGWYKYWSKLYQRLMHKPYKKGGSKESLVLPALSPVNAQNLMNLVKWRPDKVRELWDAFGAPEWFQYNLNLIQASGEQKPGAMDCDEFAIWAANSVRSEYSPEILSVTWIEVHKYTNGKYKVKIAGHNVCAASHMEFGIRKHYHIGNWGRSSNYAKKEKLVSDVWKRGSNGALLSKCVGYAFYSKDLSEKEYKLGDNKWNKNESKK
jgi:hypothetical protein